ncbi:DMT family transporter [Massilia sp. CFBP9012]|uniref:DMT family transporter n=1 Tax=Massilia sp. CFBP9012 TaxID=3096531 RepID=UPI002A6A9CCA|nr:DMT family transporter [Massilia sp. CFBP9012]MDY0977488.1 DMT family transporter [Massilia sp. CFBP9012]
MTTLARPIQTASHDEARGMLLGLVGVAMFSLTLPFTRMAVAELDPLFIAFGRALGAALLAGLWLGWRRAPLPPRAALAPLVLVALGVVIGFPLLSSMALRWVPASHGAVLAGLLPLMTALYSAMRGDERPSAAFWLMAVLGAALVIAFALSQGGGALHLADLLMFLAVAAGAVGYAEGGKLARTLGGPETISWALLLALPLVAPWLAWHYVPRLDAFAGVGAAAWAGLAYMTVFSMFVGFFFWYRGMALGGIARVGQVQLLQPFLSLLGAAVLLGESLTLHNSLFALAVIGVVFAGRRLQVRRRPG